MKLEARGGERKLAGGEQRVLNEIPFNSMSSFNSITYAVLGSMHTKHIQNL